MSKVQKVKTRLAENVNKTIQWTKTLLRMMNLSYIILLYEKHVRRKWLTKDWKDDVPHYLLKPEDVGMSPDDMMSFKSEVERALRHERHFEGTSFSFRYKNQEIELRRPEGLRNGTPREVHLRARWSTDVEGKKIGLEFNAHAEYSRYEAMDKHIQLEDLVWLDESEVSFLVHGNRQSTTPLSSS